MSDTGRWSQGSGTTQNTNTTDSLSVSEQCELLSSNRRRAILRYLTARPGEPVDIDELADFLLAHGEEANRQDIILPLQHVHLPKLADAGVITYQRDQRQLTYRGARELGQLLDFLEKRG